MEHIAGPFGDLYLAAYTEETSEGYFAYCKACAERPVSARDGTPGLLQPVSGPYLEEITGLMIAIDLALNSLPQDR